MKSDEETKMDIDLRHLISECEYLRLENKSRRIYCMTKKRIGRETTTKSNYRKR
nr:MAG TPA: hypothetical protein [Caudoviricetes sp.]